MAERQADEPPPWWRVLLAIGWVGIGVWCAVLIWKALGGGNG